ncbi:MAG: tetratricopeptide repeat protein, partial [Chitinophagaceae bacterium]
SIDEGVQLLQQLKEQNGILFIKRKLKEPHIRFRSQHGNDNYFLALVYKTFVDDFGVEAALQQADLALSENVHFEGYQYPHGIIYELKATLYQLQQNNEEAARLYYLAGKEQYWNASYAQANTLFARSYQLEKEHHLSTPLIDNYWYYAECLVQQSYTQTDPFVDEAMVKKAAEIWYEAYAIQKPSYNDAWAYLTATLIHEQLSKLPDKEKQEELFYCWFYAEHNILIDNTNPKAWGFISRAFSSNILDRNAVALAQKAYALDSKDPFIWEERAISLLNTGRWQEAEEFLQKLIAGRPAETAYKAYKGLALYNLAQYAEAKSLLNEVVEGRPDWIWARNLRLIINWMLHDAEAIKKDAEWIWDKQGQLAFKNTTTHEFAYAAYFLGYEQEALKLFAIAPDDNSNEIISSLFFYTIYYALKTDEAQLQVHLQKYIKAARHAYNFTEMRNAFAALCPGRTALQQELEKALKTFQQQEPDLLAELHQFADVCTSCKEWGSVGWEAIQLSFFRLALEHADWKQAFDRCMQFQMAPGTRVDKYHLWNRLYTSLKEYFLNKPKDFLEPERRRAIQQYADASPFSNLESLADLYLILSIAGREQPFLYDDLKSVALEMYQHAGIADIDGKVEEWMKICAELLPELKLQAAELSRAEGVRVMQCMHCGVEINSRTQKYCFVCGQRLQ